LRTVMSSIIRRRRGLIAAIGLSYLRGGLAQPKSSQMGDLRRHSPSAAAKRLSSINIAVIAAAPYHPGRRYSTYLGDDPDNIGRAFPHMRAVVRWIFE
jgi:hypothetical protein